LLLFLLLRRELLLGLNVCLLHLLGLLRVLAFKFLIARRIRLLFCELLMFEFLLLLHSLPLLLLLGAQLLLLLQMFALKRRIGGARRCRLGHCRKLVRMNRRWSEWAHRRSRQRSRYRRRFRGRRR
jgi:hypothetical protein